MSERGFFCASNDIKTLDGNIFSGFPWLTTHLLDQHCAGETGSLFLLNQTKCVNIFSIIVAVWSMNLPLECDVSACFAKCTLISSLYICGVIKWIWFL